MLNDYDQAYENGLMFALKVLESQYLKFISNSEVGWYNNILEEILYSEIERNREESNG